MGTASDAGHTNADTWPRCRLGHDNPVGSRYCADCGQAIYPGAPPTWATVPEAWRVVCYRRHLRASLITAGVVGSVLFAINQLDVVLAGDATATTYLKSILTYVVPFCVANSGVLIGTRQHVPG